MKKLLFILFVLPTICFSQVNVFNNTATIGGTTGFTMTDSQWNDLITTATNTKINPTVARPVFNYDSVAIELIQDADSSDIMYFQYQLPHSVEYGTSVLIYPHFHYMQYSASDTTFEMVLKYRIRELGNLQGSWVRTIPSDKTEFTYATGSFHQICEFPAITLNNITESSFIEIKLFRKDGAGNPATLWMLGFDIHIPIIRFGTLDEYPSH